MTAFRAVFIRLLDQFRPEEVSHRAEILLACHVLPAFQLTSEFQARRPRKGLAVTRTTEPAPLTLPGAVAVLLPGFSC